MQLEQQETFEIKSPQLEVFGQVESKLPAPCLLYTSDAADD